MPANREAGATVSAVTRAGRVLALVPELDVDAVEADDEPP